MASALHEGPLGVATKKGMKKAKFSVHHVRLYRKEGFGLSLQCFAQRSENSDKRSSKRKSKKGSEEHDDDNNNQKLKLRQEFMLEKGCEVREVPDEKKSKNVFIVITSKIQQRFQASNAADRSAWIDSLNKEFAVEVELALHTQKTWLLMSGGDFGLHTSTPGEILKTNVRLSQTEDVLTLIVDKMLQPVRLQSSNVSLVESGNHNESFKKKLEHHASEIFHFNCFSLTLVDAIEINGEKMNYVDLEAPDQKERDEWVSALQTFLAIGRPENLMSINAMDKANSRHSSRSSKARSRKRRASLSFTSKGSADNNDDSTSTNQFKNNPELNQASSTLTEFFKSKVKLGSGFDYARCISHALVTASGGDQAKTMLFPKREITDPEFKEHGNHSLSLPPIIDPNKKRKSKKKPKNIEYEMLEYAPSVFTEIRNRVGISEAAYSSSLSTLSGNGAIGDGKSGMLFFYTKDRKYVLKTVKPGELDLFMKQGLFEGYTKHLLKFENSLICRFLGLYTFKKLGTSKDFTLVAMSNSFDTRLVMHEKYDLKGSTRNRWCTPKFGAVLKDLNLTSQLYMDADEREQLIKQLDEDSSMLERHNVMDYSLLLGIHKPTQPESARNLALVKMAEDDSLVNVDSPNDSSSRKKKSTGPPIVAQQQPAGRTKWQRDFGGIESRDNEGNPVVYIMTLIDILQGYDLSKKAERAYKSSKSMEQEISAVNPTKYKDRFISYLAKIIEPKVGVNKEISEFRESLKKSGTSKADLEKAAESTLNNKAAEQTAGYVETLEDGTEITILESGGFVQVSPDGTTLEKSENGRSTTTFPDGTIVEWDPVTKTKTTKDPDGNVIESKEDGGEETLFSDGTRRKQTMGGSAKQINPDGSVIQVDSNGNPVLQLLADGTRIEYDTPEPGDKTQTSKNGVKIVTYNDDGRKVQTFPDRPGVSITTFQDGSTVQTSEDGTRVETSVDGSQKTFDKDGNEIKVTVM